MKKFTVGKVFAVTVVSIAALLTTSIIGQPVYAASGDEKGTTSLNVYVDSKKVDYPVELIIKEGTTLVPIRETFEAMGAKVVWNQEKKSVQASKGNRDILLQIGSSKGKINNDQFELTQVPFIHKGKTMIPLRFVGEAFSGIVHYDKDTKDINITMPKFTSDFLKKEQGNISNIQNIDNVKLTNNRRLMLSDNPETLDSNTIEGNNATLWNDVVKENRVSVDHRVVGWHVNKFDKDVTVGITIENFSDTNTIEIKNIEGVHKVSAKNYEYDVGLPIAEAVLNDELRKKSIKNRGQELILEQYTLKPEEMVGFLNDFTVIKSSGTGELNYVIRTVVTKDNSSLTEIKTAPVSVDQINAHPRGVWSGSELLATIPVYDLDQGIEQSYNISNGITDNILNEQSNLVTNATTIDNKGHYGAVYTIKIPYVSKSKDKTIRVRIGSRGGTYSGTVKTENGVYNIPTLQPMKEVVNVLERKVNNDEGTITLELMHAGGSYLPISINIDTIK